MIVIKISRVDNNVLISYRGRRTLQMRNYDRRVCSFQVRICLFFQKFLTLPPLKYYIFKKKRCLKNVTDAEALMILQPLTKTFNSSLWDISLSVTIK